jgi:membrane-associated phospholipid phosphatase
VATISDGLVVLTAVMPVVAQLSDGASTSLANAGLIYAEAHAVKFLLSSATKFGVRRPRPYTHSRDPRAQDYALAAGNEAHLSFFSQHASTAFTSAMAGSVLFAARSDDLLSRHVLFGFEFALAGVTAQLRVRAGRHYRRDVWVGTLVGLSLGFGLPALHGVAIERVRATEWATAGGALAVSFAAAELVDLGFGRSSTSAAPLALALAPLPVDSGTGVALSGRF